ncbi:MAG: hypothetical protein ACYCYI_07315 [Saccharofermentanales bacterium]
MEEKKEHDDPQPENGKESTDKDNREEKDNQGKHKGWEKKQTTTHAIPNKNE